MAATGALGPGKAGRVRDAKGLGRIILAMVVVCLGVSLALGACDGERGACLRAVTGHLDDLRSADDDQVTASLGQELTDKLTAAGVDPVSLYRALVAHFSYEDAEATVDGETGSVSLKATNADLSAVLASWQTDYLQWAQSDEGSKADDNAVAAKAYGLLIEKLQADDVKTTTADVTIAMAKDAEAGWQPTDASQVARAIFAGQDVGAITLG